MTQPLPPTAESTRPVPSPVPEAAGEVDPRIVFAAERTLLAWVRTGLAMMGFGFVVARFGAFLSLMSWQQHLPPPRQTGVSLAVGVALVVLGVVVNLLATIGHCRTIRRLQQGEPIQMRPISLGTATAGLLVLLGTLMAVYLLFGVQMPAP
jgi:putative membrane protein